MLGILWSCWAAESRLATTETQLEVELALVLFGGHPGPAQLHRVYDTFSDIGGLLHGPGISL